MLGFNGTCCRKFFLKILWASAPAVRPFDQTCRFLLRQLRSFLRQTADVDEALLWMRISNIITLTLATQAPSVPKCRNCFEVFGFDILIDDQLKPWLLEVGPIRMSSGQLLSLRPSAAGNCFSGTTLRNLCTKYPNSASALLCNPQCCSVKPPMLWFHVSVFRKFCVVPPSFIVTVQLFAFVRWISAPRWAWIARRTSSPSVPCWTTWSTCSISKVRVSFSK